MVSHLRLLPLSVIDISGWVFTLSDSNVDDTSFQANEQ